MRKAELEPIMQKLIKEGRATVETAKPLNFKEALSRFKQASRITGTLMFESDFSRTLGDVDLYKIEITFTTTKMVSSAFVGQRKAGHKGK